MRALPVLVPCLLALSGPAAAQAGLQSGFQTGFPSGLGGGLSSGFQAGVPSGFPGTIGPGQQTPVIRPQDPTNGVFLDPGSCAPGQATLNHTGCRPIETFSRDSISSYDQSIEAMSPLRGMTLEMGPGPDSLR